MMNKRGQGLKWDLVLSLMLGLIVLGLVIYFIAQEYLTGDEMGWQICRESVLLRSGNFQNIVKLEQEKLFPFKCTTQNVVIDFKDLRKAERLIGETMARCYYTYGEGQALYAPEFKGNKLMCFYCARIHFTDDVKDYYKYWTSEDLRVDGAHQDVRINLDDIMQMDFSNGMTYGKYLYGMKKGYTIAAFQPRPTDNNERGAPIINNPKSSEDGDIYVMYTYWNHALTNFGSYLPWDWLNVQSKDNIIYQLAASGQVDRDFATNLMLIQPQLGGSATNMCDVIETIPG